MRMKSYELRVKSYDDTTNIGGAYEVAQGAEALCAR